MWKLLFYSIAELFKVETPMYFFIWFFVLFITMVICEVMDTKGKKYSFSYALFKATIELFLSLIICLGISLLLFCMVHFIFPNQVTPYDVKYGRWLAFIILTLVFILGWIVKVTKKKTRIWLKPIGILAQFFFFSISIWIANAIF
ncbi:hypothetical protein ACRS6Y_10025 [Bacillus cytotoxicus]|uniref:Uncharacterized protein n=1 Tax=Bacillus cytotoxicus (strain DSM 22905 / CIP 110041 / 391-98 / NVH 391-98) TaxID=315749 RepID=A7GKA2_BACCN|nr:MULTISPECIES: hypothetical protein [Bacillus cereus group]ABS20560.1 hypothetical protein Bcer98_0193 [Bacillus cytotoxicus NVH 391-98]AWC27195.1 hypothetical protein CG483_001300 [Bacillus cytotoxicus]AWC31233.1 hypothetical protein CG482_001200 [Bacillus cytotoxicus]AWC35275.1 hypothetical protein CG481_001200 [Bacillus cytotoxicus]AWC39308.1 hypothetical protein CG480_001295 [Bacillus cytotoxicus]